MYKTIIVAVDTAKLERAEKILERALGLVDPQGRVIMINVVEDMPAYLPSDLSADMAVKARQDADRILTQMSARVAARHPASREPVRIEIRQGTAAREILHAAEELAADLIIVASHLPDLSNYLIGATADRVVRHARCSVLIDR